MSGPEAQKPDDQLLDEFLAGEGAVRAAYRDAAQPQAPAHLDAAILQAAQAAARPVPRVRRRRWQMPMAAAAVMALSFSVLLQVQRDPTAQKELMTPPDLAAMQGAAKAEVLAEAAPVREETDAEQKQAPVAAAKRKASLPAEKRRAAPVDAAPPTPAPPAMAMADAPSPAVAAAPEPEAAAMAADAVTQSTATGAVAGESMSRQQRFATAAAPMAKASRAPLMWNLMSQRDASETAAAAAIERWAQSCAAESPGLSAPTLWRGLAVAAWSRQAESAQVQTTLLFAPEVSHEAITTALDALAAKATLTSAQCAGPVTRELRQSARGWALVCECTRGSERSP